MDQQKLNDSERLVVIEMMIRESRDDQADHETRIRKLEKYWWLGIGFSAAAGSAGGSYLGQVGPTIGGG